MTARLPRALAAAGLLALASCGGDRAADGEPAPPPADARAAAPPPVAEWHSSPTGGVAVRVEGDTTVVETGPHAVLWPAQVQELSPPYTVRASLRKRSGRLHEGVGIVFGGTGLDQAGDGQRYGYFMVRGDGSYLVKRREGAETPVVRDWTRHPAVGRDAEGGEGGRVNELEVRVTADEVVFVVNGAEVERVPAAELPLAGRAGLRVSHDVQLAVAGFQAGPSAAAPASTAAPDSAAAR